ncbi:general substrate transporter [Phycomyces nitens]|nr:general substrate transporter [Phycomyces nitens]
MPSTAKSQDVGFTSYMIMCACVAAISGFTVGWHISVPNMPQAVITKCTDGMISATSLPACLPMSDFTWGYTIGAFPIGGFFGSIASMYLNNQFGRRTNMLIACGWMIAGGILSSCAINIVMYSFGRAFVGVASGMSGSSVAIYVSEISTTKSRGALGSLFELFLNTGILITQICGMYMSTVNVWRLLWAIPTFLAAIQVFLLVFFVVESPRYLCSIKKNDEACVALQRLRSNTDIEEEFAEMLAARQREENGHPSMNIWDIITVKDRKISWNTVIVMVLQAYNQVGGIGPISVYSVGFLTRIFNGDSSLATDISLAAAAGNIVAVFIAIAFMNRIGRKGFMLISTAGTCIASIMMVVGSSGDTTKLGPLVITAVLLFTFTYSMGCGVIPWMIAPELLPLHALSAGSALGNGANWLCNFVINTVWPYMDANLKQYSFTVFVALNFVAFVFLLIFMPETTGRDIDFNEDSINTIGDTECTVDGYDGTTDEISGVKAEHINHKQ